MKKIMYILTFLLCFTFMENINAEIYSCFSDGTDTCIKRVYKYGKEGNIKDYEITLGVFHFKRGDSSSENKETLKNLNPCPDIGEKYCENIFRIYDDDSDRIAINVSSNTEVFPIAICAQPGEFVNSSNVHKYVYFTEEDINNNKTNCLEKHIFYSEEAVKKINTVCTRIKSIKALNNIGYINNYSISGKMIGGGVCELTIKYQEVKDGPETVIILTAGNEERCYNSLGYKLVHNKSGDPIHPTNSWELQYCKLQEFIEDDNPIIPGDNNNDDINDKTDTVGFLDLKDKEVMCNGYTIPYGLPYIIHKIINFIKIIVPIILIILGLIDYSKAVMSGSEDEMKKNTARFIKRTISAIIVFFVIAIVQFAFNILGNNDTFSCFSCFVSGDDCNIVTKE